VNEYLLVNMLEKMNPKQQAGETAADPLARLMVKMLLRNKSAEDILRMARERRLKGVMEQQEKIARALGLIFISPVWFVGFPAFLKGWFEGVFTAGFAFGLSNEGWNGDLEGRIPLLKHEKFSILSAAIFNKEACDAGFRDAIKRLYDDFTFRYPWLHKASLAGRRYYPKILPLS
jgi:NAD(P)H dehydrogenase (quinone)